jgi:DAACS family dicarboxylate/amino acid:cation (Na+ or H+) symporter
MLLVRLVPLAVFCVTARTVGEYGFTPFRGLALYVTLAIVGMCIQIVCIYPLWIQFVGGLSLKSVLEAAKKPMVYAFGTNSSLATLPLTLQALDSLRVSKSASRLGACVGTNLNNDGIVLYEAMAVLFVAQAFGLELTVGQQLTAALMSLVAAIGVAGIPEAGVVSLSLVLTAVGLPLEIVPLLLTVDWIVARMRSVTNVLSDFTVSIGIDGLSRRSL